MQLPNTKTAEVYNEYSFYQICQIISIYLIIKQKFCQILWIYLTKNKAKKQKLKSKTPFDLEQRDQG